MRFDHAYCQYPLCNPTRSSVLSGRYPTSTGVLDNDTWLMLAAGQQTLTEYFAAHGYDVELFGKIYHGPNRGSGLMLRRRPPTPKGPSGTGSPPRSAPGNRRTTRSTGKRTIRPTAT